MSKESERLKEKLRDVWIDEEWRPEIESLISQNEKLCEALDKLVHACEDEIDAYNRIDDACEKAKLLLPDYKEV